MGNNCVSRLSKDGFFQLWWPRTPDFLPYRKKGKLKISKPIITNEPEQPQEIQSKPPELFVIVRDDTKLPEPVKPAQVKEEAKPEPVHQEQPPTKAKPAQVKEEDKRQVEQPPTKQEQGKIPIPIQPQEVAPAEKPKPRKPHNVRRIDSAGLRADSVLKTKTGLLKDFYNLGEKLGNGQFGTTFLCVEKSTGKQYACKSIAKRKLLTRDDVDDVRREIEIMHHLSGHQNVISIKGAYEDPVAVHVVMELCSGGELFDRIVKRGHYSEKQAADLSRTIVRVIEACHSMGVMHRDLKPENFLFVDQGEDSSLKTIDFGLSIFFKPGQVFSDVVGSPYYVAPEVLLKHYGPQADVWSAGVIIYILLCGAPPFWGENEDDIFKEVLDGDLDFTSDPWPNISESAKDLLRKMLIRDPRKRLTAHEVLCHPWVRDEGAAPDKPLDSAVLSRLKQFSAMNRFKKMALRVIAGCLSEEEIAGLKEMFKALDTDNSGQITFDELKTGLKRYGASLSEPEIRDLMEAADIDRSGTIDYGEFIAAMLHLNKIEREDHLFAAFSYFDKDGSGFITMDELQQACKEFGIDDTHLEEIIREIDQNNDGRIDYDEFVAMMQKGNAQIGRKLLQNNNGLTPGFREALQVF